MEPWKSLQPFIKIKIKALHLNSLRRTFAFSFLQ